MRLQQALPAQSNEPTVTAVEHQAPFYRFYLLRADGHIAARRGDYFVDDPQRFRSPGMSSAAIRVWKSGVGRGSRPSSWWNLAT
jgi:hypothetical protein